MGHSARRRSDLNRMKAKALKVYHHMEDAKWANHLKGCSCHGCRNPRHSCHHKGQERLTMQERKAWLAASDQ